MRKLLSTRTTVLWILFAALLLSGIAGGAYLLGRRSGPSAPVRVVVQLPTAAPAPTPTPLPTRSPEEARLQGDAANRVVGYLREVARGRDPYTLPGQIDTAVGLNVCPRGCERPPKLVDLDIPPTLEWRPADSFSVLRNDEVHTTVRARLTGTKAVDYGTGPERVSLDVWIDVALSRRVAAAPWEPLNLRVEPPLVSDRVLGDQAIAPTSVPARPTDPITGLEMPVGKPEREALEEHERLANEVLLSISTLAAGEPIPFPFSPGVGAQLAGIVSRYAPAGFEVTGLSLEPVEWERVEVRDPETLELVGPETTASMVGYLSGSVWLTDANGVRSPKPLNPRAEHLVVNLEKQGGAWTVTNVSDGKLDQDRP